MISKTLLLLTLFLIPLLEATPSFGFEQIKILYFIVLTSLIGLFWMGKGIEWTLISKVAGVFMLCLLITSITGIDLEGSILGKQLYFQGWVVYVYLFLFFLAVSSIKVDLKYWAISLTGSAALVSLLAIRDWVLLNIFNIPVPTYAGRVISTFGQPNFYAGFLLLALPFSYFLFRTTKGKLKIFGLFGGVVCMAGVFVSYSRSAILLALILIMLGLIDQLKTKLRVIVNVIAVVLTAFCIGFSFSSGFAGNEFSSPLSTYDPDLTRQSVEKRVYIWPVAWQVFLQRPIFGYGLEDINKSFVNYFKINNHILFEANSNVSPVLLSLKELNVDRTHNYILDLLLFSGILGVIPWLVLVGLLIWKCKSKILMVSLITYLIWIQFQNQSVVQLIYFWLIAGLIDS